MKFTEQQNHDLSQKLDKAHVASRSQAGRQLSYIEGWHVIAEANRVFGFDGWNRELIDLRMIHEGTRPAKDGSENAYVGYIARVRVTVNETIVREGVGYGEGIDKFIGQAHESAVKEAETDAMKRALMTFGNIFGLALYDKSQANVEAPAKAKTTPSPQTSASIAAQAPGPSAEDKAREDARKVLMGWNVTQAQDAILEAVCEKKGFKWYAQVHQAVAQGVENFDGLLLYIEGKPAKVAA